MRSIAPVIFILMLFLQCGKSPDGKPEMSRHEIQRPPIVDSQFLDAMHAWLTTADGKIVFTADGGKRWNSTRINTEAVVRGLHFINPNQGWSFSQDNRIWQSLDGGYEWVAISRINTSLRLLGVQFTDEQNGWAYSLGPAWKTTNGGAIWTEVMPSDPPSGIYEFLSSLSFTNSKIGLIGCHGGAILLTTDSGITWKAFRVASDKANIEKVYFVTEKIAFLTGFPDGLYKSVNGGGNWKFLPIPGLKEGSLITRIYFLDENEGWIVGINADNNVTENKGAFVMHTGNGGKDWVTVPLSINELMFTNIFFSQLGEGWLSTENKIYATVDYGKSWNLVFDISGK